MVRWLAAGAWLAALAVALGAFGAHGLKARLAAGAVGDFNPKEVFETAARYHMYHALALVAVGIVQGTGRCRTLNLAGWLFAAGIFFFSGSLYVLSLTSIRWLGAITPIGGVGFIAGWAILGWKSLQQRESISQS